MVLNVHRNHELITNYNITLLGTGTSKVKDISFKYSGHHWALYLGTC